MSLHYLLDGYNIIHQMPAWLTKKLEEQRLALVQFIEVQQPQGSLRNAVTVVFDGQPGMGSSISSSAVKVIFSQYNSADDCIREIVQNSKEKKNIIVVTDDRDIYYSVKAMGAQCRGVKEFIAQAVKAKPSGSSKTGGSVKFISNSMEFEITSEMKKIWLDRGKK